MGNCDIYTDIASVGYDEDDPSFKWHYAKSVFNWDADWFDLAYNCAWDGPWEIEPRDGLAAVYIITSEASSVCKIGISNAPAKRLASLQTGHWDLLRIHSVLWVWDNMARTVERAAHAEARSRNLEPRGEWIKSTSYGALELVLSCAKALNVKASGSDGVRLTIRDECAAKYQVGRLRGTDYGLGFRSNSMMLKGTQRL